MVAAAQAQRDREVAVGPVECSVAGVTLLTHATHTITLPALLGFAVP